MSKAGPTMGLPFFLLLMGILLLPGIGFAAEEKTVPSFQQFESSCIDLGHYDEKVEATHRSLREPKHGTVLSLLERAC